MLVLQYYINLCPVSFHEMMSTCSTSVLSRLTSSGSVCIFRDGAEMIRISHTYVLIFTNVKLNIFSGNFFKYPVKFQSDLFFNKKT